jgi:hypothetical protein
LVYSSTLNVGAVYSSETSIKFLSGYIKFILEVSILFSVTAENLTSISEGVKIESF